MRPVTGPNGAARSMPGGREVAGRGHLSARRPVDPALPFDRAVDERDDAFGQPGQLVGLEVRAESNARHVEQSVAGAGRQPVLDADVGDQRPRRGMVQRARRPDVIAGDGEVHIVALQRIEARVGIAVRNHRRAVDDEILVPVEPLADAVAEQQRHLADRRAGAGEIAAEIAAEDAVQPRRVEQDRRACLASRIAEAGRSRISGR